jgi:hypothetical protein
MGSREMNAEKKWKINCHWYWGKFSFGIFIYEWCSPGHWEIDFDFAFVTIQLYQAL